MIFSQFDVISAVFHGVPLLQPRQQHCGGRFVGKSSASKSVGVIVFPIKYG